MKVETIRCDNCDKARDKDTNHWSLVAGLVNGALRGAMTLPSGYMAPHFVTPPTCFGFTVGNPVDACGDECRFALMTRFLATGRFERKSVAEAGR